MSFLSIVARHMTCRPHLFAEHERSLAVQTERDFEHVVIVDDRGRGGAWANTQFVIQRGRVTGDYVLMLDDDDRLTTPDSVAVLKRAVRERGFPDLLFFKSDHGRLGILPDDAVWEQEPVCGHVGGIDFVTRNDVWQRHIGAFAVPSCGDYHYLRSLWNCGYRIAWWDGPPLTAVQRISFGAPD